MWESKKRERELLSYRRCNFVSEGRIMVGRKKRVFLRQSKDICVEKGNSVSCVGAISAFHSKAEISKVKYNCIQIK